MALIKCPECGKEISDKAGSCPHCGCPINREEKIKEGHTDVCPDCNNEVTVMADVCPHCGRPLKSKPEKYFFKVKQFLGVRKNLIKIGVCALIIIVIVIVARITLNRNEFSDYTKYIGKNYEKLPKYFELEDLEDEDDTWVAVEDGDGIDIGGVNGQLSYYYSKMKMPEYNSEKKEVYQMHWDTEDIQKKEATMIKDALSEIYGDYDDKHITDFTDDDYDFLDVGEEYHEFIWKDKQGLEVELTIYKDDDSPQWAAVDWTKEKK